MILPIFYATNSKGSFSVRQNSLLPAVRRCHFNPARTKTHRLESIDEAMQVFWGEKLAAVGRRPLAVWMAGFSALAWLPSATAEQAEKRLVVPEPIAAPAGEWTCRTRVYSTPNRRKNPSDPPPTMGTWCPSRKRTTCSLTPNRRETANDLPPTMGTWCPGRKRTTWNHPRMGRTRKRTTTPVKTAGVTGTVAGRRHLAGNHLPIDWRAGRVAVMVGQGKLFPPLVTTGPSTTNQAEAGPCPVRPARASCSATPK